MPRPRQVVPLLVAGTAMWLAHLALVLAAAGTGFAAPQPASLALAAALATMAFWGGALLVAAALLRLVLTWDRRTRDAERHREPAGIDWYG